MIDPKRTAPLSPSSSPSGTSPHTFAVHEIRNELRQTNQSCVKDPGRECCNCNGTEALGLGRGSTDALQGVVEAVVVRQSARHDEDVPNLVAVALIMITMACQYVTQIGSKWCC